MISTIKTKGTEVTENPSENGRKEVFYLRKSILCELCINSLEDTVMIQRPQPQVTWWG